MKTEQNWARIVCLRSNFISPLVLALELALKFTASHNEWQGCSFKFQLQFGRKYENALLLKNLRLDAFLWVN